MQFIGSVGHYFTPAHIASLLRYFQGDIKAASYENHGTDIYIYVQALAKESVSWSRWHDH